ncbi:MAG: hypothetical protein LBF40_11295, partial [Deltaproteobacteria bacterium]|nr:hypothetical protein [Deltaproteobacteria bacterium]
MLRALMLLAADPSIGGLLLVGEKGTAKSTAARGLAELLPPFSGNHSQWALGSFETAGTSETRESIESIETPETVASSASSASSERYKSSHPSVADRSGNPSTDPAISSPAAFAGNPDTTDIHDMPAKPARAPFRTIPLGVTEERLLGGLDLDATLATGRLV